MEEEHDESHESYASVRGETETSEGTPEFKGKRKVSDIWQYFVKKKEERKAQCKVCGKELAYHGGTSNLREHLCNIHPLKYSGSGHSSESSSKEGPIDRVFKKSFALVLDQRKLQKKLST